MSQVPDSKLNSEEEYRNIFEGASDGLVIYDIGLETVVEANQAACEIHGYTRQEFIGLNPAALMLPEGYHLLQEQIQMLVLRGGRIVLASGAVQRVSSLGDLPIQDDRRVAPPGHG